MTTLKSLVDETTNIKNELVECHSNLSNILTSKNVEVSEEDKMSDLIGKVDLFDEYDPLILYLYKEGDECVGTTGLWKFLSASNFKGSNQKLSDRVRCTVTIGSYTDTMFITNNKIDLSKYSKAYLKTARNTGTYGLRLCVRGTNSSYGNSDFIASVSVTPSIGVVTVLPLNISALDSGYICVDVVGNDNKQVDIFEIWLEK